MTVFLKSNLYFKTGTDIDLHILAEEYEFQNSNVGGEHIENQKWVLVVTNINEINTLKL